MRAVAGMTIYEKITDTETVEPELVEKRATGGE